MGQNDKLFKVCLRISVFDKGMFVICNCVACAVSYIKID